MSISGRQLNQRVLHNVLKSDLCLLSDENDAVTSKYMKTVTAHNSQPTVVIVQIISGQEMDLF